MKIVDDKPWFAPKLYGFGTGLPIAWQGWAVLAAFVAGIGAAGTFLEGAERVAAFIGLTALVLIVAKAKTQGGWRWRNSDRD